MNGYIDGIDFINLPAEKYWTLPKTKKDVKTDPTSDAEHRL